MTWYERSLAFLASGSLLLAIAPADCAAAAAPQAPPPPGLAAPPNAAPSASTQPSPAAQQSPDRLDQLVAPIALYPDALVAQILATSADPTEIVEADRWLQKNASLKGTALAQAINKQTWDPSVKALMQFPSILGNMDKNLGWTSALGDASASHPQAVLNAVQVMRRRAEQAGNLKSTSQEAVTSQGQTVVIQPANPAVVYVPQYDPWIVYGAPVGVYPYWDPYPGLYLGGPGYAFGLGIGIGLFAGFGWGWGHWGADWHGGRLLYDHRAYISRGAAFRHNFDHAHFAHAGGFHGVAPHARVGFHSGASHGFDRARVARDYADRGRASFGAGFHGAVHGGFHGGGHR
jgi:Protein of unknown function (DUF3300)